MNLKDYFYFQKGDRLAVILLLLLIVLCGGGYILLKKVSVKDKTLLQNEVLSVDSRKELNSDSVKKADTLFIESKLSISNKHNYQEKLRKSETIDINAADTAMLKKVPGIGTAFSNRIVKYRNLLGGYIHKAQLREVYGIDEELYSKIEPYITIKPNPQKIRINTDDFKTVNRHPYISYEQTKVIMRLRQKKGKLTELNDLLLFDEFTQEDIKRISAYVTFD